MYSDDKVTAEAQKVMLEILKEIHKICVANDIKYWLNFGTLLGAVRHKGFIPWDDDCDICMSRKDYNRFVEIAQQQLPETMFLQTAETDPGYTLTIAKVRKKNTLLIEEGETGDEPYCHGIFVDVFPFDYYKYGWFLKWVRWRYTIRERKKEYKRGSLKRMLVQLYTNVIMLIPVEISKYIIGFLEGKYEYFSNPNYEYMAVGLEHTPVVVRTEDIYPTVLVENIFEGEDFYIPANSDACLRACFGPDYMTPLPPDKRGTHNKKIEV